MKNIIFNSLKLPYHWDEFNKLFLGNQTKLQALSITVHAYIPEPKNIIPLDGYIKENIERGSPKLTRNSVRYTGRFTITDPNLQLIDREIKKTLRKIKILHHSIQINSAILIVNEKLYEFKHNSQAKGLTLIKIDNQNIGLKFSDDDMHKLIDTDFYFCVASKCKKTYKESWECY